MRKKIWIMIIFVIAAGVILWGYFAKFNESSDWNYEGQAVVLVNNPPYELVEITDVTLDGELYGFGKYFLGDLRVGTIEAARQFEGNPESPYYDAAGIMTMYRHNLALKGEKYFDDREVRKLYRMQVEPAWTFGKTAVQAVSMLQFYWFEWYGGEDMKVNDGMISGHFYFKETGEAPFAIETHDYIIVPGVSTREGALAVLHENFDFVGLGNFKKYYRHYAYPSELEDLSVSQKIEQCRIPESALTEMTVEQLVWAVIDFPPLAEVGAAPTWEEKISLLKKNSDAFAKLTELDTPEKDILAALKNAWKTRELNEERMWRVYSSVAIVHDIAKNVSVSPCVELVKAILLHSQGEYFTFDEEELGFLSGE